MPDKKDYYLEALLYVQRIILAIIFILLLFCLYFNFSFKQENMANSQLPVLDKSAVYAAGSDQLFGNLLLKAENELSLSYAKVMINGQIVGDLTEGKLLLRVHPGDLISVDCTAYHRELQFYLEGISSNIDSDPLLTKKIAKGNIIAWDEIVFK